ncbi:MAG: hypothetical protein JXO51_05330 [Candidatus Aminicenantes bacterium]|nr:hypothetical protein [Candidatus Aminicenantes bacterium]
MKRTVWLVIGLALLPLAVHARDGQGEGLLLGPHVDNGFFFAPELKWTRW